MKISSLSDQDVRELVASVFGEGKASLISYRPGEATRRAENVEHAHTRSRSSYPITRGIQGQLIGQTMSRLSSSIFAVASAFHASANGYAGSDEVLRARAKPFTPAQRAAIKRSLKT